MVTTRRSNYKSTVPTVTRPSASGPDDWFKYPSKSHANFYNENMSSTVIISKVRYVS